MKRRTRVSYSGPNFSVKAIGRKRHKRHIRIDPGILAGSSIISVFAATSCRRSEFLVGEIDYVPFVPYAAISRATNPNPVDREAPSSRTARSKRDFLLYNASRQRGPYAGNVGARRSVGYLALIISATNARSSTSSLFVAAIFDFAKSSIA